MTVAKRTQRPKPNAELMQLADSLLTNYKKPEDLIGKNGLLKQLTKMLVERALEAEMAEHLGHDKSDPVTNVTGNARNGHSAKTLKSSTKIDIVSVPYNGIGPAIAALLGGQVQLTMAPMAAALPHVTAGKLRPLAVTSTTRSRLLPEVPTMDEAGVPGYEFSNWYGLLAPARTPRAIVSRLNREVAAVLDSAALKKQFSVQGLEPTSSSPEEFATYLKSEIDKWGQVVRTSGARFN